MSYRADELHVCLNPLCRRQTLAMYCCSACDAAAVGGYEIHEAGPLSHSSACDERNAERGELGEYEAEVSRARARRVYGREGST